MHEMGFVHGDVKPSNLLLSHDLRSCKITDFGETGSEHSAVVRVSRPLRRDKAATDHRPVLFVAFVAAWVEYVF